MGWSGLIEAWIAFFVNATAAAGDGMASEARWESALVDILTALSITAAAGFGALGLFTEYRKNGKVTPYGKIAVIGILASAVISLAVNFLQDRIEAKADKRASERFNQQIGALERLSGTLSQVARDTADVQGGVRTNLLATERAGQGVRQSLFATRAVQGAMVRSLDAQNRLQAHTRQGFEQERSNTETVLRTMWNDNNRVSADSLELFVEFECRGSTSLVAELLKSQSRASVRVAGTFQLSGRDAVRAKLAGMEPDEFLLEEQGSQAPLSLFPEVIRFDGDEIVVAFNRFITPQLGPFSELESWRDAFVEAMVRIPGVKRNDLLAAFQITEADLAGLTPAPFKAQSLSGAQWHRLPCGDVEIGLLARGRLLAHGEAQLYYVEGDGGSGELVVHSEPARAEPIPIFTLAGRTPAPATRQKPDARRGSSAPGTADGW